MQNKHVCKIQCLLNEHPFLYLQSLWTIVRDIQIPSIHNEFQHLLIREALVRLFCQAGDFPKDHTEGPANNS